ncbi:4-galactosyl-N-acetylglucosaminide 3-alpha-L-fucosyltransferase FUT5-like [Mytilus galloprovincialis]|uniref:4-galactosyl-N-acetylglucosaminide 3-alpha-L-fucosyltransferase FUT5-like n=1 Tax=Mytilus galloprovincialis TaxID=29158 RepID=UPI003F7CAED2
MDCNCASLFQKRYIFCIFATFWILRAVVDDAILVALKTPIFQQVIPRSENKSNYLLLWYAPPFWARNDMIKPQKGLKNCVFKNCDISFDKSLINKSDVLLFHQADLKTYPPFRTENQMWIYMTLESPVHMRKINRNQPWNDAFNWTMSYRKDSDIFTPYAKLSKRLTPLKKNYTDIFKKKSKDVAWIVSNCLAHSKRMRYVQMMKKYINVDIFGNCGKLCTRTGDNCMKELSRHYKFYLSFENSLCEDYVTEKAFKLYKDDFNIVPVIRGAPNIKDILPNDTFISTSDFNSTKVLALYLRDVALNKTKYLSYLQAKDRYTTYSILDSHVIEEGACALCKLLNSDNKRKGTVNVTQWALKKKCFSPVDIT